MSEGARVIFFAGRVLEQQHLSAMAEAGKQIPVFKNRTEQVVFFAKKLALLCMDIVKESGRAESIPGGEALMMLFDNLPPEMVVSYIMEADEKFGAELENEQLSSVAKLVALASSAQDVHGIAEDMEAFTGQLEKSPELKKKFFCYVKLLRRIIHS